MQALCVLYDGHRKKGVERRGVFDLWTGAVASFFKGRWGMGEMVAREGMPCIILVCFTMRLCVMNAVVSSASEGGGPKKRREGERESPQRPDGKADGRKESENQNQTKKKQNPSKTLEHSIRLRTLLCFFSRRRRFVCARVVFFLPPCSSVVRLHPLPPPCLSHSAIVQLFGGPGPSSPPVAVDTDTTH